jgi:hypothetical protein
MNKLEILLVIDSFTPDTLPTVRLAAYMREFATLLGSEERVHFKRLRKGSACVVAFPDEQAAPKVKSRLEEVLAGTAPRPVIKARQDLDDLLADDNAVGHVELDGARILEFPGRLRPIQEKIGPVRRSASIEGEIFQIGGKDETINVHLRGRGGETRAEVSIELARRLAPFLLLGQVRMFGEGDWYRVNGKWERHSFTAVSFTPLDEHSLTDTLQEMQGIFSGVSPDDFASTMAALKGE